MIRRVNLPVEMNAIRAGAIWVAGRILAALVVFQLLAVGSPFDSSLSPLVRLVALVAVPGTIELAVAGWWVLEETNTF